MGNSVSSGGKGHHEDTVDFGRLTPQGVYTGPKDWNHAIVTQLICERKLAPFYRPLEDYEDDWDDEQILAARRDLPETEAVQSDHESSHSAGSKHAHLQSKRSSTTKEDARCPEAAIYRGAVECPICFLYYPPNINHSRCCDQAICTECFVQIKRADPTTTHIVSEPAACPYCVQDNFGVHYIPPAWRAGIGSDGSLSPHWLDSPKGSQRSDVVRPAHKRRQKSFGADSPEVVTTDQIRPDWEHKLAAVRAAVARRANRRIIMRQVGDRLIPVGVTSGRVHPLSAEEAAEAEQQGGSRRSRRSRQNGDLNQLLGQMGLGGQDVEELMMMEAMRLSLLEHEEYERREAAKKQQNGESTASIVEQTANTGSSSTPTANPHDGSAAPLVPASLAAVPAPQIATNVPQSTNAIVTSNLALNHSNSEPAGSSLSGSQYRQSNPPPFSTLAAAMSSANAATAIISNHNSTGNSTPRNPSPVPTVAAERPRQSNPPPFSTLAAAMSSANAAQAILSNNDSSSNSSAPTSPPPVPTVTVQGPAEIHTTPSPTRPTLPPPSMSFASSVFSTESNEQTAGSTYDVLGSETDSEYAREPLLGSDPPTPTEAGQSVSEIVPGRLEESLT